MLQLLWNQLAYLGVLHCKEVSEHKHVILVNGLTMFSFLFNLCLTIISFFLSSSQWVLVGVAYNVLLLIVFYLNAKGRLFLGRFYFGMLSFLYLIAYALLEGNRFNAHYYLLMIAVTTFFTFPNKERAWLYFFLTLSFFTFAGFDFYHKDLVPLMSVPELYAPLRNYFFNIAFAILIFVFLFYIHATFQRAEGLAQLEHQKSERLLENILPIPVIQKLRENPDLIAEKFENCTVLFSDIVGFTEMSRSMTATHLVSLLNEIFSSFDDLAEKYQLEKIKTIGDAYMVVGGIPEPSFDHAEKVALFAIDMKKTILNFGEKYDTNLQIRIGINTGEAVAGVIGKKKFIYDLWGASVNTASRMESHGLPGEIHVSETTYQALKSKFIFIDRGLLEVKGIGKIRSYILSEGNIHGNTL